MIFMQNPKQKLKKDKDIQIIELTEDVHTLTQTIQELNRLIDDMEKEYHTAALHLEKSLEHLNKAITIFQR